LCRVFGNFPIFVSQKEKTMYLPVQRQPMQRSIVGRPADDQSRNSGYAAPGVASENGIQPSGWFDDIIDGAKQVAGLAGTVAPLLGSFGI
jgi:hypothetical protein